MNKVLYFLPLLFLFSFNSSAQCGSFVEKVCNSQLSPYTNSGFNNVARIGPGEAVDFNVNFYSALDYRLMVCSEGEFSRPIVFRLRDLDGKILFDSQEAKKEFCDLRFESSQMLVLEVDAPPARDGKAKKACVAVLVGLKA